MRRIYNEVLSVVDKVLESIDELDVSCKDDNSLVSSIDLQIEENIIKLFQGKSKQLLVIAEESYSGELNWDLTDENQDFLILDPIDGTENFIFLEEMFGIAASWRLNGESGHLLYIPKANQLITDKSELIKSNIQSSIDLYSTKCITEGTILKTDSARIFGSSSYMFSLILTGKARSYTYSKGAKIWDCYTGLTLAKQFGLTLENVPDDYFTKPCFKQNFIIQWK